MRGTGDGLGHGGRDDRRAGERYRRRREASDGGLLESIHRAKTGALLRASVRMGAIYAGADDGATRGAVAVSASMSGWRFRLWMTFWMWSNRRRRWGRRRARTRRSIRLLFRRCMGWSGRARWRRKSVWRRTWRCSPSTSGRSGLRELADLIVRRQGMTAGDDMAKIRLDQLLVERGLAESREKAQALIMAGQVLVDGQKADKPGTAWPEESRVEVLERIALRQPRRAEAGRRRWSDLRSTYGHGSAWMSGASTGGFTDCLLQHGAARVHAMDVGHGQIDWRLRNDPRVVVQEGCQRALSGARGYSANVLIWLVCDVSFISVTLLLPALRRC